MNTTNETTNVCAEIGERIRTQDNRCTAEPIFLVQQKRIYTGIDLDYADLFYWVNADDYDEVSEEENERLTHSYYETGDEPEGFARIGYIEWWEFVTCCFTEQGCKDYIAANGHNLKEPRIYADSLHRNREMITVRAMLKGMTP